MRIRKRMLERKISFEILPWAQVSHQEKPLILRAVEVRDNAQAPYSHYHVGVALLASTGRFYTGCNVERASYSQTSHAEQVAIDAMVVAEGPGTKITAMAIAGAPQGTHFGNTKQNEKIHWKDVCPSCGHCLQIIWENCLGDPDVPLIQVFPSGWVARTTIGDAFPFRFGPSELGIDLTK